MIKQHKITKGLRYHGHRLTVPVDCSFIVTYEDGGIWACSIEPNLSIKKVNRKVKGEHKLRSVVETVWSHDYEITNVGSWVGEPPVDWKNSLVEY